MNTSKIKNYAIQARRDYIKAVTERADFVNWVKKTFLSKESNSQEIAQLKILKPRPTPDALIQAVSDFFSGIFQAKCSSGRVPKTGFFIKPRFLVSKTSR
jgi:hypothetical protein